MSLAVSLKQSRGEAGMPSCDMALLPLDLMFSELTTVTFSFKVLQLSELRIPSHYANNIY